MLGFFKKKDPAKAYLGELSQGPSSSIKHQLEQVRTKIETTSQVAKRFNDKLANLTEFNKSLTEGYINNLNVLIEISDVLNQYQTLMEVVINELQTFDSSISEEFKKVNIDHIRDLTSSKLSKVNNFFKGPEYEKLRSLLLSHGKTDIVSALGKVDDNLKNLQINSTNSKLFDGGKKPNKRVKLVEAGLPPKPKPKKNIPK
jgi:hypothetical protein